MSEEISMAQRFLPWIASFLAGGLSGAAGSKIVLSQYGKNLQDHEDRMRKMEQILAQLDKLEAPHKSVSNGHESRLSRMEAFEALTKDSHETLCRANSAEMLIAFTKKLDERLGILEERIEKTIGRFHKE